MTTTTTTDILPAHFPQSVSVECGVDTSYVSEGRSTFACFFSSKIASTRIRNMGVCRFGNSFFFGINPLEVEGRFSLKFGTRSHGSETEVVVWYTWGKILAIYFLPCFDKVRCFSSLVRASLGWLEARVVDGCGSFCSRWQRGASFSTRILFIEGGIIERRFPLEGTRTWKRTWMVKATGEF